MPHKKQHPVRTRIIASIKNALEPNRSVYAFWLEGADGYGKIDEFSDLDLWFDVKDGQQKKVLQKIERVLEDIAPIDLKHSVRHPDKYIQQFVYHLKGTSKYLLLDICIQSHQRKFSFIKGHTYEIPRVVFDKAKIIRWKSVNQKSSKKHLREKIDRLTGILAQQSRTEKYIHRGQFLEALAYYHKWILAPLVELLRIKHVPLVSDYGLVKISSDLPRPILHQLENLYQVTTVKDIQEKMKKADSLFRKTLREMENF